MFKYILRIFTQGCKIHRANVLFSRPEPSASTFFNKLNERKQSKEEATFNSRSRRATEEKIFAVRGKELLESSICPFHLFACFSERSKGGDQNLLLCTLLGTDPPNLDVIYKSQRCVFCSSLHISTNQQNPKTSKPKYHRSQ